MTDFDPYGRLILVDDDFRVSSSTDGHRVIKEMGMLSEVFGTSDKCGSVNEAPKEQSCPTLR